MSCCSYSRSGNGSEGFHLCASQISTSCQSRSTRSSRPYQLTSRSCQHSSRSCQLVSRSLQMETSTASSGANSLAKMRHCAGTWNTQQQLLSYPSKYHLSGARTFSRKSGRSKLHRCSAQQPLSSFRSSYLLDGALPQSEFVSIHWTRRQIQAKATGNAEVVEPDAATKLQAGDAASMSSLGSEHDGPEEGAQKGDSETAESGGSGRLSARWLQQSLWDDNAAEAQRSVGELITTWRTR